MNHWQKYARLYTGVLIFISVNAGAAVVVFKPFTPEQLAAMSGRQFIYSCIECIALASANLLTYVNASAKPQPPVPSHE